MKLLIMKSAHPNIRATAVEWDYDNIEDPKDEVCFDYPADVWEALRDGWRLLGPPQVTSENLYVWWLTKEDK